MQYIYNIINYSRHAVCYITVTYFTTGIFHLWCPSLILPIPMQSFLHLFRVNTVMCILWTRQPSCARPHWSFSLSRVWLFATHALQHASLPCPSPSSRAFSNSCPVSRWCHPTILSSVVPFSSCLRSFPASGSFPMSWLFVSGGHSIGASASASGFPMNIQNWLPLRLPGWISLQSKGLSRVFSNITDRKHQFFGTLLSLWSNSHIHT